MNRGHAFPWIVIAVMALMVARGEDGRENNKEDTTPDAATGIQILAPATNAVPAAVTNALPAVTNAIPSAVPAAVTNAVDKAADGPPSDAVTEGTAYEELAILTEALVHIRRHYVEERSYREILFGALDGMLQSLDPYSRFMPPEEFHAFEEDTEGLFTGVGIQIGVREGMLTVIAPIDGSPAYRAGIIAGDRILRIDGEDAYEVSIHAAAEKLRGQSGESVVLTLGRSHHKPFDVRIVREPILVPSVRGERMLRPGIGYLRITKFDEQTMPAFRDRIEALRQDGLQALVLDLRSNPGGLMQMAVRVAELFLERGKIVVSVRGRDMNGKSQELRARGHRPLTRLPLAILVDEGSASAAEVVAGALQDHHRGVLFGMKTFGKASVQTVITLNSQPDCGLRLTTAHYFTPSGRMIHGEGIQPDIVVDTTPEQRVKAQMRRAYEEAPGLFPDDVPDDVRNAPDLILDRAVDVLAALVTLGAG